MANSLEFTEFGHRLHLGPGTGQIQTNAFFVFYTCVGLAITSLFRPL